jgi:ectoine hydroxylase-related dioxygenase (phytanoyl-CoA dioxygenase family)
MDLEFGNTSLVPTDGTGWFIGFSDWTKAENGFLRFIPQSTLLNSLCVKWACHKAGEPNGEKKPLSEGKTISILVSQNGKFRLDYDTQADFTSVHKESFTLKNHGDFVIWGPGLHHRAFGEEDSCIITIRWFEG